MLFLQPDLQQQIIHHKDAQNRDFLLFFGEGGRGGSSPATEALAGAGEVLVGKEAAVSHEIA